jgi:hypothetical protein
LKAKTFSDLAGQFPPIFFLIFVVFGAVGIVPFHRFIAAHCNQYKYTRYMNNYRLFYYQLIADELKEVGWRSAIEKDPLVPIPQYLSFHWSTFFAYVMLALNTTYISLGLYLWDGTDSNIVPLLALLISFAIHAVFAVSEMRTDDVAFLQGESTGIF